MAQRSGLGAQLGVRKEDTYGTYKAPNRFIPLNSETLSLAKEFVRSAGLRAGRMAQAKNLHRGTTRGASGDINFELFDQGMGGFFDLFHGDAVVPAEVGESEDAFGQLHKIGLTPPWGKSTTVQIGRPDTGGTVQPFSYLGCKGLTMKIAIEASGIATISLTLDSQDEVTSETLAVTTYDADALPFTFQQMDVLVGAEPIGNVRSITIEISVPQKTDRLHLGNKGLKDQPIANALAAVTANASLEFASLVDHNRYKNEEVVKLALTAVGEEIDEDNDFAATFTLPAAKQVSSGPQVAGPDVLTTDVSFEGLDNGTDAPLEVELISTDTAL
jgi:hypothetical protein